jgi:adenylylsulfate kinase
VKPFLVWLTGLSGAGKTTLSMALDDHLLRAGIIAKQFDGDVIGSAARAAMADGTCAIVSAISPYRDDREKEREITGESFIEVFVDCGIARLVERDTKGLYARALAGEIENFTGLSDPYEPPVAPEVHCRTDVETERASLVRILDELHARGFLESKLFNVA